MRDQPPKVFAISQDSSKPRELNTEWTWKRVLAFALSLFFICGILVAAVCVPLVALAKENAISGPVSSDDGRQSGTSDHINWPSASTVAKKFRFATVATAEPRCSTVGTELLAKGGSAVDAIIGAAVCLGALRPTSSGIGGGAFLTYYKRSTKTAQVFDSRETAPGYASEDMYINSTLSSLTGGGAIGVPGEIHGFWEAHQQHGRLQWDELFKPTIDYCENGFEMDAYVSRLATKRWNRFTPELKAYFTNSNTGDLYQIGEKMHCLKLAQTLRIIASEGAQTFYNGTLSTLILQDLRDIGSNITAEDLANYTTVVRNPVSSRLETGNITIYSPPPPSSGVILQYMLNILDGYGFDGSSASNLSAHINSTVLTFHRIIESMKFGHAKRQKLGDEAFVDVTEYLKNLTDPHWCARVRDLITDEMTHENMSYYGDEADAKMTTGTSQITVIAGNGDAASMTSTINTAFGSKEYGTRTGILFNNEMDDFSTPGAPNVYGFLPSKSNFIKAGKRPMSSMSPSIVTDGNGEVKLVTGGSGGSKIISGALWAVINRFWFNLQPSEIISRPRLHHQLAPDVLHYDNGFPEVYLEGLAKKGHTIADKPAEIAAVDSASQQSDAVFGMADPRRFGRADGF